MRTIKTSLCGLLAATFSMLAMPAAASPVPVGTLITGSATSGPLLSLDDAYTAAANPQSATLSDGFGDLEFLSDDFSLGLDFLSDGTLRVYDIAGTGDSVSNSFDFDFAGLTEPLTAFLLSDLSALAGGSVSASLVDADTVRLTLSQVSFGQPFAFFDARIDAASAVPEPASLTLAVAGLLALGARRRRIAR